MNAAFKDKWLPARALMVLFTVGLLFHFQDRLPMTSLASDASLSGAVTGMIGKAVGQQQKVEKALPELEAAGEIDATTAAQLAANLEAAAKDLTNAYNLMSSTSVSSGTTGFYYARLHAQDDLTSRLNLLMSRSGSAEAPQPPAAEEAPPASEQ